MSLFQGCPYFRGVLISGVFLFQGCPYFRGFLISGVSLFQGCPYFRGVRISGVSLFQGVLISGVSVFQGCSYFRSLLISGVLISGCLYFRGSTFQGFHCTPKLIPITCTCRCGHILSRSGHPSACRGGAHRGPDSAHFGGRRRTLHPHNPHPLQSGGG